MDAIILSTAFGAGYLMYRLGLPPLVGFLLAGLGLSVAGVTVTPLLQTGADVGVTLLLFTIGLKLKVKNLLKPEVWAAGGVHMALTVAAFGFAIFSLGFSSLQFFLPKGFATTLTVAFALSFSSTVFAVKILEESGRMSSLNGRTAIGVLIVQDIVAVVYLTFAVGKMPSAWALLIIGLLPFARIVFIRILDRVGHGELMVLLGLFMALIAGAHTFESVKLKPDLGALIIGMLMAPHPRATELADALLSIKDVLLVGFFLQIGLIGMPDASGVIAAAVLVLLLPIKLVIYFFLFTRFTLKARTSFMTTMNLANYSEFGLIVCSLAASQGYIDKAWLVVLGIALSISFIIASPLNKTADVIFEKWAPLLKRFETRRRHEEEKPYPRGDWEIVIFGMGRVGEGAYDWFSQHHGNVVLGFDFDRDRVSSCSNAGRNVLHADVTDPDFWRRQPIRNDTVRLVVLAMSSLRCMLYAVGKLKASGFLGKIGAVAYYDDEVAALTNAGVDTAFNVFGEAGAGLAAHVCETVDEYCPWHPPAEKTAE